MPGNDEVRTPIPAEGLQTKSTSQMAEKCLESISAYRKGPRSPLAKATAIQEITTALTSATPELTEAEINDALGSYLGIIE